MAKGNRKPRQKVVYKDASDRFRQISNKRAKVLVTRANQLNTMLPQPSYGISPEDAKALHDYILNGINPLIENLEKIINNQPLRGKAEVTDVYTEDEQQTETEPQTEGD